MSQIRRKLLAGAVVGSVAAMLALPTTSALAVSKAKLIEEFRPFADCPVTTAAVCTVSYTTSGEIKMGNKAVPIDKTVTLQGGLGSAAVFAAQPLVGATDGNTLSKTPLSVPGGLAGVQGTESIVGEVTATAELAGPPSSVSINRFGLLPKPGHEDIAVTLPLKIHLENPTLGNECYVGSDTEPIVLNLTVGMTKPPPPAEPISGEISQAFIGAAKGKITLLPAKLVDNTFSVPGATGCGAVPAVTDNVVDLQAGVPSAAGSNRAIMKGTVEETASEFAAKYRPKVKRPKK